MTAPLRKARKPSLENFRVTSVTLVEEVGRKLKEAIFTGVLKPGDRLIELELSASLGVSRPILREAIRGLQAERLCEITPHRGAQIPILSWTEAEQIYYTRALLEGEAAALCAVNISKEAIDELHSALKAFGDAVKLNDPFQRIEATALFYAKIMKFSGNAIIEEVLTSLVARVNFLRARSMSVSGRARKSYAEMEKLYLAIKKRDPKAARAAAEAHVKNAQETAKAYFVGEEQA